MIYSSSSLHSKLCLFATYRAYEWTVEIMLQEGMSSLLECIFNLHETRLSCVNGKLHFFFTAVLSAHRLLDLDLETFGTTLKQMTDEHR